MSPHVLAAAGLQKETGDIPVYMGPWNLNEDLGWPRSTSWYFIMGKMTGVDQSRHSDGTPTLVSASSPIDSYKRHSV